MTTLGGAVVAPPPTPLKGPPIMDRHAAALASARCWNRLARECAARSFRADEDGDTYQHMIWWTLAAHAFKAAVDQIAVARRAARRALRAARRDEEKRAACGCDLTGLTPPAVHLVDDHEGAKQRLAAQEPTDAERDRALAQVDRVRELLTKWVDEYGDPVYRGNGWAAGVFIMAREALKELDGDQ